MRIVWDERKRLQNIEKHRYDFATLTESFFEDAIVLPSKEGRFKAINEFEGRAVTAVFKPLGMEAISLVSMRRASRHERRL